MSAWPTATRDRDIERTVPVPPYPTADLMVGLVGLAKEIVVDWQMPSDLERTG